MYWLSTRPRRLATPLDGSGRWMPLTEKAKALAESALEPFGDDRETASTV